MGCAWGWVVGGRQVAGSECACTHACTHACGGFVCVWRCCADKPLPLIVPYLYKQNDANDLSEWSFTNNELMTERPPVWVRAWVRAWVRVCAHACTLAFRRHESPFTLHRSPCTVHSAPLEQQQHDRLWGLCYRLLSLPLDNSDGLTRTAVVPHSVCTAHTRVLTIHCCFSVRLDLTSNRP